MNTWRIEGGDGTISGNENPNKGGSVSGNVSPAGRNIAGSMVSTGVGIGLSHSPVSEIPGASGIVAGAAGDLARGKNPGQIAKSSGIRAGKTAANYGLRAMGIPGYMAGPGVSIGMSNIMESQKANPNYGKASVASGVPSIGAMLGGMAAGPLGALVGGIVADAFTQDSLESGFLGDWTDSRSYEYARDAIENQGFDRGQSDSAVLGDSDLQTTYDTNSRNTNATTNPNVTNYDPLADNPTQAPAGWRDGDNGSGGGYDSAGSGYGDSAADAASDESGLGSMY